MWTGENMISGFVLADYGGYEIYMGLPIPTINTQILRNKIGHHPDISDINLLSIRDFLSY